MSRTKKPCPACGEVDPRRKADDVCYKCRQLLDVLLPALQERVRKARGDREPYFHHVTWHWNPDFYGPYDFSWSGDGRPWSDDAREQLARAFDGLVEVIGERPEPGRYDCSPLLDVGQLQTHTGYNQSGPHRKGSDETVFLYPEQRVALQRMFASIEQALGSVFAEGQRQGKQMIHQMLGGEMSMNEINEMVIGEVPQS